MRGFGNQLSVVSGQTTLQFSPVVSGGSCVMQYRIIGGTFVFMAPVTNVIFAVSGTNVGLVLNNMPSFLIPAQTWSIPLQANSIENNSALVTNPSASISAGTGQITFFSAAGGAFNGTCSLQNSTVFFYSLL